MDRILLGGEELDTHPRFLVVVSCLAVFCTEVHFKDMWEVASCPVLFLYSLWFQRVGFVRCLYTCRMLLPGVSWKILSSMPFDID